MDAREVQRIIRDTSRETVHEALKGLGLTTDSPHELQADMHYLRRLRKGSEFLSLRAKAAVLAALIPALLWLLWQALKDSLQP
jgi:hypothetical protein